PDDGRRRHVPTSAALAGRGAPRLGGGAARRAAAAAHRHAGLDEHTVHEPVGPPDVLREGPDALPALVTLDERRGEVLAALAGDARPLGQLLGHVSPPA